jgi:hypothetical protein
MPREQVKRGKRRVFDAHTGGRPVPAAVQDAVRLRILNHAQKHHAGKFIRIDVRFRGALCYIDAYCEPRPGSERLAALCGEVPEQYAEGVRNTPVHLVRLRYFGEDRWSVAFYTYSHEKYSPLIYPNGDPFGTVEQAFDIGAVYLD